jgi:hypothetical protein
VTIARPATFLPCFAVISPLFASVSPVLAAPAPTSVPTLSFDVTARVGALSQGAGPQQTVEAKVLLRGNAARVESRSGGAPSVVLFSPPYIYRLLPRSKAGVRWKVDPRKPSQFADLDPQQLLRDPAKIKLALLRGGAKMVGKSMLSGVPVEIYQAKNFGARGQNAKVWLRRTDSLPLRLEASGGQFKIVASWRNYTRPRLSSSLFVSPAGYKVRTLASSPPYSSF